MLVFTSQLMLCLYDLQTDWNDGYYLCAIVQTLGGEVSGWPNLDRSDHLGNCQKGRHRYIFRLSNVLRRHVEPLLWEDM